MIVGPGGGKLRGMDFRDSPEEAAFRAEVRAWIAENLPDALKGDAGEGEWGQLSSGHERDKEALAEWRRRLQSRGWVAPAWPKKYGGAELPVMQQFILKEEMARARAPRFGGVGIGWVAPTLMQYGEEWMKERFIEPILSGKERWCQGFSEPGAGSDLASVQTRAVRDGDDYVINGQKIWTSGAHIADWMILLARTDPSAPKHKGLSYFLVDMKSPGITLSPIINMVGNSGFNQVFFENVRVPARNMVGEENRGWYVAATTLDFERSLVDLCVEYRAILEEAVACAKAEGLTNLAWARHRLADLFIEVEVARNLSLRVVSMQARGVQPNYEASIVKLYASEVEQRMAAVIYRMAGLRGQITSRGASRWELLMGRIGRFQLHSVAATIGGGTSEVQRNIIATRGLGLPRA
ncbi:alkylation response protein AidB-like acyl-CoA dehydrogenase [Tepidiforma thermophila]|uniref:Alkylation response protein AidB-like acyl-CoA dehydrogenase n=2 Tax=Tepidiforma thermophila (strain KCTC 52669 / CGMCC 1.13589 / G233) TaxID=2761530 RepID=A0A2A9HAX4_TEPT2|nr:alkylation response protein AidB-like acyl-CoA dehydrogenase [Tepidiforma thermophila]